MKLQAIANLSEHLKREKSTYFEKTYIGTLSKNDGERTRWLLPILFCSDRLIEGICRTTNALEAWRNAFARTIGLNRTRPTVYSFFHKFCQEQSLQETRMATVAAGEHLLKAKKKYTQVTEQLLALQMTQQCSEISNICKTWPPTWKFGV